MKHLKHKEVIHAMLSNDTIKNARQANLAEYLLSINVPLVKTGRRYKHKDHDSLVFTENSYYWNSRQEHGNAVDYLTRHLDMTFNQAVEALTGDIFLSVKGRDLRPSAPTPPILNTTHDMKRAIAYLNKTRRIDYSVISHLIKTRHLFQEAETNNIIFPFYDENGLVVGGEVHSSLSDKHFKSIISNSKYGYGFNVQYTDTPAIFDYALFFESAIDLISFIDLKVNHEHKPLNKCLLTSLSGLKLNVLQHTLKTYHPLNTVLCIDNDHAADRFRENLKSIDIKFIDRRPPNDFKDFNEYLRSLSA
jgi:hypothetical protein